MKASRDKGESSRQVKGWKGKRGRDVLGAETHALPYNVIDLPVEMPQVTEVKGVHVHM